MDLKKLRYFVVTATEGSLHRASLTLAVAQPALSRQIRNLEEEIGTNLFIRSSQGVKLSRAGEVLLTEAKRLLAQVELAKKATQRAGMGKFGIFNVGLSHVVAELRFPISSIVEARRQNPDIDYRINFVASDYQVSALDRGELDVGLHYRRGPLPPNMRFRDLRTDSYLVAVPKGHRLTRQPKVKLIDLESEELIFASRAIWPTAHDEILRACLKAGLSPRMAPEVEGEGIMMNMVIHGLALAFVSDMKSRNLASEGVVFLPVEDFDVTLSLTAMWNADRETQAIHDFIDILFEHMTKDEENHSPYERAYQPAAREL